MSPSSPRRTKSVPTRHKSLDKTLHYRRPDEEEVVVLVKQKKSVTFSDVIAIDVKTGEAFTSFSETRESVMDALECSLFGTPCEQAARESFFWKNRKAGGDCQKKIHKRPKNIIVKGWNKLHHRLNPALRQAAAA